MKIALFGGAGFIGVNLTRALAQQIVDTVRDLCGQRRVLCTVKADGAAGRAFCRVGVSGGAGF